MKCTLATTLLFPAASTARTSNVWPPAAMPVNPRGDPHGANAAVSIRQARAGLATLNTNTGDDVVVAPSAGLTIATVGATVSTVNDRVTGKPPADRTENVYAPSASGAAAVSDVFPPEHARNAASTGASRHSAVPLTLNVNVGRVLFVAAAAPGPPRICAAGTPVASIRPSPALPSPDGSSTTSSVPSGLTTSPPVLPSPVAAATSCARPGGSGSSPPCR